MPRMNSSVRTSLPVAGVLLLCCILLLCSGCGESISPEVAAAREKYLTAAALDCEQSISNIRDQLKSGQLTGDSTFVVRARINAGDMPPWGTGTAAFVITDATGHADSSGAEHNPHTCPFCSRNIQESIAQVQFPDESGLVIPIDARDLFQLKDNQLVVIEGTGHIDDSSMLIIQAVRMSVR